MCYNISSVRVTVNSHGANWKDSKSSEGEFSLTDSGCMLNYSLDGDKCVLTVNGETVTQERRGEQNVSISFERGKTTQCTIGNGGLSGGYEIFTRNIEIFYGKGGFKISLEYESGSEKEIINLSLTAVYKKIN